MFSIYDGRQKFYQWDLDRKLIVDDNTISEVHFCNRTDECSLVCEVYDLDGLRVVNVPNVLLQTDWRINVYGYDVNYTKHNEVFEVERRSKPADYIYTETEIKNYDDLAERIAQIEENGISDAAVEQAIEKYLEENDIRVDLTGYATETYVDEAIAAIPEVDLSDYAKKTDIPSTSGLATEKYVNEKFNSIEIPEVDLTGYATEDFVKQEIAQAQIGGEGGEVDLSNYYTKSEVDKKIEDIELTPGPVGPQGEPGKDGADGKTPVKGVDYFDGTPGKDGYTPVKGVDYFDGEDGQDGYTPVKGVDYFDGADGKDYVLTEEDKAEIAGMVDVSGGEVDLTDYYTKTEVDNKIPDVSGFQTQAQVIALINEYASGEPLPASEEVKF